MRRELITMSQDPKETPGTPVCRDHRDRMDDQVRVGSSETGAQMEGEGLLVRRVQLDHQETQALQAALELQVHRAQEESEVSPDQ